MRNCGRCGKPLYHPHLAICAGCMKMMNKTHSHQVERENRKRERLEEMAANIGGSDDDHDASELDYWGLSEEDIPKGKKRRG